MIYLVTALHAEAKPFIEQYGLKKMEQKSRFQIFGSNGLFLIVSGSGALFSAIATTYLLTRFPAEPYGVIFNVGICGSSRREDRKGEAYLCHKIIHHDTGRVYYPDILIRHSLKEAVLETFSHPVHDPWTVKGHLVDMEGAGFYEAASSFLPPHNIYCIKVVSDFLEPGFFSQTEISKLIESSLPPVADMMEKAVAINRTTPLLSKEEEQLLSDVCTHLRFTAAMRHQLMQMAKQYKIRTGNSLSFLEKYLAHEIHSKNEGKIFFEQIKRRLVHP